MSDNLRPYEPQHSRPPCPSSTPGVSQTHVHWVSDAIQPSHPLSSLSPPTPNLSQHQGFFKWVGSLHQVAKVLELQLQHQFPIFYPFSIPTIYIFFILCSQTKSKSGEDHPPSFCVERQQPRENKKPSDFSQEASQFFWWRSTHYSLLSRSLLLPSLPCPRRRLQLLVGWRVHFPRPHNDSYDFSKI